jgi:hypothetical protein
MNLKLVNSLIFISLLLSLSQAQENVRVVQLRLVEGPSFLVRY